MVVLGASGVGEGITTYEPTLRNPIVVVPIDDEHVVVELDCIIPILTGDSKRPIVASDTEAVVIEMPGLRAVVTFAHNW
jgi:hypothetical protein